MQWTRHVVVLCRFLGCGSKKLQQAVQITASKDHLPTVHARDPKTPLQHGLPLGYSQAERQRAQALQDPPLRNEWSDVKLTEWGQNTPSPLQWTAAEMVNRAARAEQAWRYQLQKHRKGCKPEDMSAHERSVAYKAAEKDHKRWVSETGGGVQGMPSFSQLSYFRCFSACCSACCQSTNGSTLHPIIGDFRALLKPRVR